MTPRLISFKTCPFVKKAERVLHHKGIRYDTDFIDLAEPPAWFPRLSPLKKVPILQVGEDIIFESSVIREYLDEAYPGRLPPRT